MSYWSSSAPGDRCSLMAWALFTGHGVEPLPALFLEILDEEERSRADSFRYAQDRHDFICAHALRRALLAWRFARSPGYWRFTPASLKRPQVLSAPPGTSPEVTLTHSHGLVAAAVTDGRAVGVDAEDLKGRRADPAILSLVCDEDEQRALDVLNGDVVAWQRAFLRLWVRKEAFVKAVGVGLSFPLTSIRFTPDGQLAGIVPALADLVGRAADWQLWEPDIGETHHLAVVARMGDSRQPLEYRYFEPAQLALILDRLVG